MNEKELLAQAKNFFVDLRSTMVGFFDSYQWQEIVFTIKIVFVIISILLLLLIILLIIKINIISPLQKSLFRSVQKKIFYPTKPRPLVFNKKRIKKKLEKIDKRLKSGLEANYKLAVLEAEKLFDRVVKNIGYGAKKKLSNITEIKAAGKIKKQIIEDKKIKISKDEAESAVEAYKKGLEELLGQ